MPLDCRSKLLGTDEEEREWTFLKGQILLDCLLCDLRGGPLVSNPLNHGGLCWACLLVAACDYCWSELPGDRRLFRKVLLGQRLELLHLRLENGPIIRDVLLRWELCQNQGLLLWLLHRVPRWVMGTPSTYKAALGCRQRQIFYWIHQIWVGEGSTLNTVKIGAAFPNLHIQRLSWGGWTHLTFPHKCQIFQFVLLYPKNVIFCKPNT